METETWSESISPANEVVLSLSVCFLRLEKFCLGFILSSRTCLTFKTLPLVCVSVITMQFPEWWLGSVSLTCDWRVDNCRLSWPQWVRRLRGTKSSIPKEPSGSLIKENQWFRVYLRECTLFLFTRVRYVDYRLHVLCILQITYKTRLTCYICILDIP